MEKAGLPGDDRVMSYISNLALRSIGLSNPIKPRVPAFYEPLKVQPDILDIMAPQAEDHPDARIHRSVKNNERAGNYEWTGDYERTEDIVPKKADLSHDADTVELKVQKATERPMTSLANAGSGIGDAREFELAREDLLAGDKASEPISSSPVNDQSTIQGRMGSQNLEHIMPESADVSEGADTAKLMDQKAPARPISRLANLGNDEGYAWGLESASDKFFEPLPGRTYGPGLNNRPDMMISSDLKTTERGANPDILETTTLVYPRPDDPENRRERESGLRSAEPMASSTMGLSKVRPRGLLIDQPVIVPKHSSDLLKAPGEKATAEMHNDQPVIKVTIGRIEVKAVSSPERKAKAPAPKAQSTSLEEYLRSIRGGF